FRVICGNSHCQNTTHTMTNQNWILNILLFDVISYGGFPKIKRWVPLSRYSGETSHSQGITIKIIFNSGGCLLPDLTRASKTGYENYRLIALSGFLNLKRIRFSLAKDIDN